MKKRIIILDENYDTLLVLSEALAYYGYEVKGVSQDDLAVFNIIEEFKPDLLLFDVFLSEEHGSIFCNLLKENSLTNNLPLILISAYPMNRGQITYNCDETIDKPFELELLLDTISGALAKQSSLIYNMV